jgi:caffeoyl-CoA O-methyltransferase
MNKSFGNADEALERYVIDTYEPEDAILAEARERAAAAGLPGIQIAPLDTRHLEVLVRAAGVRKAVEIGTLGGYSGVSIARGLMPGGVLHTIDIEPRHAAVAAETFRRAGVEDRVRIHVGAARDVLRGLAVEGPFDFCFIDADKEGYADYLDWAARNLRAGGLVAADNAFLFGALARPPSARPDSEERSMRAFHDRLARSGEFRATVLPTGEGLALGVRV